MKSQEQSGSGVSTTSQHNSQSMENEEPPGLPLRIAIIGGGPRGLYSLERIFNQAKENSTLYLEVSLYEPSSHPGAGKVYAPSQPDWLMMNYSSRHIDAWRHENSDADESHPDLTSWLARNYPDWSHPDQTIPRRITGEYLSECYEQVLAEKPNNVKYKHVQATVKDILRQEEFWTVLTVQESEQFDEVLLCLGHGSDFEIDEAFESTTSSDHLRRGNRVRSKSDQIIKSTYPVHEQLSTENVAPGSKVALRGFGLTFIDACLTLTEGRGGQFTKNTEGEWEYIPTGQEPGMIYPYSRSGRPMLAKPDYQKIELSTDLDRLWEQGQAELRQLEPGLAGLDFVNQIQPIILKTAARALQLQHTSNPADEALSPYRPGDYTIESMTSWLAGWNCETIYPTDIRNRMQHSYLVATAQTPPGEAWAIGETWRPSLPCTGRACQLRRLVRIMLGVISILRD
ncbi:MAG: FAD/NAD(P)-binding protein [Planctomycetaceae bacterium]